MLVRRVARPLLAATFVVDGVDTLMHPEPRVKAADALVQQGRGRLPEQMAGRLNADPEMVVRINAGAQVAGGVLLALGKAPRLASLVLAATVVPATLTEQNFWAEPDPDRKAAKRIAFLKDVGLLGGLLIASADTEGKPSLGWRGRRAARKAAAAVSAALPIAGSDSTGEVVREHVHDAAVQARALGGVAATKGAELAEAAQTHGSEWAEIARQHAAEWTELARKYGAEWAEIARQRGPELAHLAKKHGAELAELARERGPELAAAAREHGAEWADAAKEVAKDRGPDLAETIKLRSAELAALARERGDDLATVAKEQSTQLAEAAQQRARARWH